MERSLRDDPSSSPLAKGGLRGVVADGLTEPRALARAKSRKSATHRCHASKRIAPETQRRTFAACSDGLLVPRCCPPSQFGVDKRLNVSVEYTLRVRC